MTTLEPPDYSTILIIIERPDVYFLKIKYQGRVKYTGLRAQLL
jgi:hypothetical protein